MATAIAKTSIERVSRLLRAEFDSCTNIWQEQEAKGVIQTAKDYGLSELALQMQNDL